MPIHGTTIPPAILQRLRLCIDSLVAAGVNFAICREQGCEPRLFLQPDGGSSTVVRLTGLSGRGFLFAPFQASPRSPIILIRREVPEEGWGNIIRRLEKFARDNEITIRHPATEPIHGAEVPEHPQLPGLGKTCPLPTDAYRDAFEIFREEVREGNFHKLVLARDQAVHGAFSPGATFLRACTHCDDAMASIVSTPMSGTWIGATPELLCSGSRNRWRTMALAGTRACAGVDSCERWNDKNLEEQAMVADYIRELLARFCADVQEKGPYTVHAGRLCHLRTDFFFRPLSLGDTAAIVEALHPTPAVCGLPKDQACAFIRETEPHDRRYYTGYLGWWGGSAEASLYVNLRCMEMERGRAILHAGGGILAASELGSEWRETCNKMGTMLALLRAGV